MQIIDGEEITTTKGCFNCDHFKKCPHIRAEKERGRDFDEILIFDDGQTEYRYGCSCSGYKVFTPREIVQFS